MNAAYNIDCMEYMRSLPDNAFDLAVVDPPYGDAGNGDMAGRNLSGRFARYDNSQSVHVEREREREKATRTI